MMERLDEAQQMLQEKARQIASITEENNSLCQQVAECEAKLENVEQQNDEMMESDDIGQLTTSRFHNTLTIRNRTEMNLDEHGALSAALSTALPPLLPLKSGMPLALTPESSNSTTANALFFMRPGVSPNDTDSVMNLVGCDSRMSFVADELAEEALMKQRESVIREKVKREMREQFEIERQQIRLDAEMEIQRRKQECDERVQRLEDEVGKYRENELRIKERNRGEMNSLRQKIDLLEFEASENENFVYAAISECDRATTLSRRSSRGSALQKPVTPEQSCRVNWGYLFGRSRRAKSPEPVTDM